MLPNVMARQRFERLPEERQDAILRTAAAEFAENGFHGTSYNHLLERLELGKSSAYYYFDDKRDLFLTALERCYSTFFASIREVEPPDDASGFWRFVEESSERGFEFMLSDPVAASLMQCLQRERALLGELGSNELVQAMDGFYGELISQGQALGAVRTDLPPDLLVALVRDMAMTFDRWFVTARADAANPSAPDPSPTAAARAFTEIAKRLCLPA